MGVKDKKGRKKKLAMFSVKIPFAVTPYSLG
jgi:hypothetical protein